MDIQILHKHKNCLNLFNKNILSFEQATLESSYFF